MNELAKYEGVWFIYDGECPVCNHAAQAMRLQEHYGELHLLNARESTDHPLLLSVTQQGLDLDEGMVIYADARFYHGKAALKFMARCGKSKTPFMAFCKSLFWSDSLATLLYPAMRAVRNWLVNRKGIPRIDNLALKNSPTFQSVFGGDWHNLPPVMKQHYRNHPYSDDETVVHGSLDILCKAPLIWLAPVMRFLGQIPAINAKQMPVTVRFKSHKNNRQFQFDRQFNLKNRKPYFFKSRMVQVKGSEVIEIMKFRLGWKMNYSWDGEKVSLSHKGYVLCLFGCFIPLPITWLMGSGNAQEWPVDENRFAMSVQITHPWWGKVYEYKGQFEVAA